MAEFFDWMGLALTGFALAALAWDDRLFLFRRRHRAEGHVVDHRMSREEGSESWAAVIAFTARDGTSHMVVDNVLKSTPTPSVGTKVRVVYPDGAAHKARVPRPALRLVIYVLLTGLMIVLGLHITGVLK